MKRTVAIVFALMALTSMPVYSQGILNRIKNTVTGNEQQQQQPQQQPQYQAQPTPPPAEANRTASGRNGVKVVEGTPPPELMQQPEKTPTKAEIKAGAARLTRAMVPENVPGNLFGRYQGVWSGDFVVYTPDGRMEEFKKVRMEFKSTGRKQMTMETFYFDKISETYVVAETAVYENNTKDVKVTIRRPNGEQATQTGRWNDGQLFLKADIRDGVEHFRERIQDNRMLVDGFAVYNDKPNDVHVFIGRFTRER